MKAPLTVSMEVSMIEALRARSKGEGTTPSRIVQDLVAGLLGVAGEEHSAPVAEAGEEPPSPFSPRVDEGLDPSARVFSQISTLREEAKSVGELAAESGLTPPEVESCLAELMADGVLAIYLRADGETAYFVEKRIVKPS